LKLVSTTALPETGLPFFVAGLNFHCVCNAILRGLHREYWFASAV
jgi:hypothetical protein